MSIPFSSNLAVSPDVMLREVGEESVLLNLKTEQYLGLDDVSSRTWRALTTTPSIQSAYEVLLAEYEVDSERLHADLEDFIQQLLQLGLVQIPQ